MAIDKNALSGQDVDLDDIEVVILVIARTPNKVTQAGNFLTRRGWPTTVMSNISQAIEFASERKPDFVLVSVNHPNPTLSRFCDLLTNTFNTTCVAFAEDSDGASANRLNKSQLPHKILGQASGPTLHRSLRKILAEKLNLKVDDKGSVDRDRINSADKNYTIKGSDNKMVDQGPTMVKGQASAEHSAEVESAAGEQSKPVKKNRLSLKDLTAANSAGAAGSGGSTGVAGSTRSLASSSEQDKVGASQLAAQIKKSLFGDNPESAETESNDIGAETSEGHSSPNDDMAELEKQLSQFQAQASANRQPSAKESAATAAPAAPSATSLETSTSSAASPMKSDLASPSGEASAAISAAAPAEPGEAGPRMTNKLSTMVKLSDIGPYSLMQKAVQTGMAKVCRSSGPPYVQLTQTEQVGVFPVDSENQPGYLILAWPTTQTNDAEPFLVQTQQSVRTKLTELIVQARLENGFFISIPHVDFMPWALRSAEFSFSIAHGKDEIGVAFVSTATPIPKARQVGDQNMFCIDLQHISTSEPVNFKTYLHFKKNQKYYLYLRDGRQLQQEQKDRLGNRKVTDVYMNSSDAENLRTYLASSFLRGKFKKSA